MKKILLSIPVLLCLGIVYTVYDANHISKEEFREIVANHPLQEKLKLTKKERKALGIPPNRYFDSQHLLEINPNTGTTHPENLEEVREQARQRSSGARFGKVPGESAEMSWKERGPNNIGGRTRVVFYDPNDVNGTRVFAGGVSGGLWVNNDITDANSLWTQVGIDENLSISCYAIDPNNSNIWYVGTGEAFTSNDGTGNGIWRTTNGGSTWSKYLPLDLTASVTSRFYFVNQILTRDNNGTTDVYFSIDSAYDYDFIGYQVSGWWFVNGGSLQRVNFLTPDTDPSDSSNATPYVFSDVEIAADNSIWCGTKNNIFGLGGGKVFRSTDGVNFVEKHSFANGRRVELSTSKINANTVYALGEIGSSDSVSLVKTTNGSDFSAISNPDDADTDITLDDFARGQAFYNLTIEVDPTNDNIVYAGGIDLFRSSDGGTTWSQISKWSNNNALRTLGVSLVHADQHAVVIDPSDNNKGIFANDGGIYYCSNLSSASSNVFGIESRNKNYNITQFYSGAIGPEGASEVLLGGTQDNGSQFVNQPVTGVNSFQDIFGGDGAQEFVDKDGAYAILSYVYNVYGTQPLPFSSTGDQILIQNDQDNGAFINTADLDDNLDILYADGSNLEDSENEIYRIFRYTDLTTFPVKTEFTDDALIDRPTAMKVSPHTPASSTVFVGTSTGAVLKVTNFDTATPTWTDVDLDEEINVGAISDIDFGDNENKILVTLHNYGVDNIYYSTDGGLNWAAKDGDFPDIPVKAIKMNPDDEDEVIIGTNMGVWRTSNFTDASPTWVQSQNGMTNVKITKFDLRASDNTVLASTYGRGLFTGQFTDNSLSVKSLDLIKDKFSLTDEVITNGLIEFTIGNVTGDIEVEVYNLTGALFAKKQISSLVKNSSIRAPFQTGVYIVSVTIEGNRYSKKIIVTN